MDRIRDPLPFKFEWANNFKLIFFRFDLQILEIHSIWCYYFSLFVLISLIKKQNSFLFVN